MNINFLYKNALPRGADVFLKMVVTVTALLCSHWTVYGQPTLPTPADGADVEIPVTLQWSTNSTQGANIEIYECSDNGTAATDIDLDGYQQQQSKALSVPAGQSGITDLSGVTYNPVTGPLIWLMRMTQKILFTCTKVHTLLQKKNWVKFYWSILIVILAQSIWQMPLVRNYPTGNLPTVTVLKV